MNVEIIPAIIGLLSIVYVWRAVYLRNWRLWTEDQFYKEMSKVLEGDDA